jgi:hypothetical protein
VTDQHILKPLEAVIETHCDLHYPDEAEACAGAVLAAIRSGQIPIPEGAPALTTLRAQLAEAVRYLRLGKAQFAPHTTNSDVDVFLARIATETEAKP